MPLIKISATVSIPSQQSAYTLPSSFFSSGTLAFGYILPTTGRIPDFHRLETCAAGRTPKLKSTSRRKCFSSENYNIHCILSIESNPILNHIGH